MQFIKAIDWFFQCCCCTLQCEHCVMQHGSRAWNRSSSKCHLDSRLMYFWYQEEDTLWHARGPVFPPLHTIIKARWWESKGLLLIRHMLGTVSSRCTVTIVSFYTNWSITHEIMTLHLLKALENQNRHRCQKARIIGEIFSFPYLLFISNNPLKIVAVFSRNREIYSVDQQNLAKVTVE